MKVVPGCGKMCIPKSAAQDTGGKASARRHGDLKGKKRGEKHGG